jgi:hypothetical protein
MVVSINPEPTNDEFNTLLNHTLETLTNESKSKEDQYLKLLGNKLENKVFDVMSVNAKGTPFENSIEIKSGQKFPDIIAHNFYGVEVKTTKQNHWKTTGNSILEGTRVEGIERIFMLFGKMYSPVEFKCRPYEDCLSEIVVTHSPRYLIDMDLSQGQTIFDKIEIPYDTLRKEQNPIKHIIEYYRQFLKPGEEVWWLEQEELKSTGLIIKLWNNLSIPARKEYVLRAMVLFPNIFSNQPDKYTRLAVWLVNKHGVVCPNIRDSFSAGGQGKITWKSKTYSGIPKIIVKITDSLSEIKELLNVIDDETFYQYWEDKSDDNFSKWIELVVENTKHMKLPFNFGEFLKDS